ncbi:MAG: hypothetical protein AB8F95_13005 [Bacteroidia bacterium]
MEFLLAHPLILVEIVVVIVVIITQWSIAARNNRSIRKLKKVYPKGSTLETSIEGEGADGRSLNLLSETGNYSNTFRDIVHSTNAYLKRNRGETDIETIENIAADRDYSLEKELDRSVYFPLYIGLLCTITGVVLGLIGLFLNDGGIADDEGIRNFIGGVLIAMIGSGVGLFFSIIGTNALKKAARLRDQGRFEYFSFLREHVVKPLAETPEVAPATEELRNSLSAFHEGFTQYQGNMNSSLQETLVLFKEMKGVLERVRDLEVGFDRMGRAMEENDRLIDKQVAYIDSYTQKAESFANILGNHFEQVDGKLNELTAEGVRNLETSTQAAYVKMDSFLASLQNPEEGRVMIDSVRQDAQELRTQIATLQQQSVELNRKMLDRFNTDDQITLRMSQQMEAMNAQLKQMLVSQEEAKHGFTNSFAFKLFTVTGALAFVGLLAVGLVYAVKNFV